MKNLDLNAYGVEEMTTQEMEKTDGGFFNWKSIVGAVACVALICTGGAAGIILGPIAFAAAGVWSLGDE